MPQFTRREFIGATGTAAVLLGNGRSALTAEVSAGADVPRPPQVPLGQTGITLSRLAQGTGVHGGNRQSDQTRMGFEKLVSLFRHSYDRGITFFDMADLYGTHIYFREALRKIPREEIAILTKMWWRYDGPENDTQSAEREQIARSTLERFRHELNTDYLDIVLLHCMTTHTWDQDLVRYMDVLAEAKEKKQVRAVGVSCHDFGALKTAASCPWVDVILARINPQGVKMDGSPEEITALLRQMKANGKAVIGMKIFGEGQLRDQREACIRFAQQLGVLDAMTIGFEKPEQIDEVLQLLHQYPAQTV